MSHNTVIPTPYVHRVMDGNITVTSANRIVYTKKDQKVLASFLHQKIVDMGGPRLPVRCGITKPGDIYLLAGSSKQRDRYAVHVDDRVKLAGHKDGGIQWAMVSLLQQAVISSDAITIPKMSLSDESQSPYRGLMVDLASFWHPIESLYDMVLLCWWYKINNLHLHFTDDKSWTLPNAKYPNLPTPDRHYTARQLQTLNKLAQMHGVTIVPEVDMPGHCLALVSALPEVVGNEQASSSGEAGHDELIHPGMTGKEADSAICPGRESTYEFLGSVISDVCELFPDSPYIHIGADEVNKKPWTSCKHCHEYMKQHSIPDAEELYRHFIVRMNDCVREHGKQTIVWEGFKAEGSIPIPQDVIVMEFENHYELPGPLLDKGYQLINTSWQPLYIVPTASWSAEHILGWNIWRWEHWWDQSQAFPNGIEVPQTKQVIGAQVCSWGMESQAEMDALLPRVAALAERTWHNTRPVSIDDWTACWEQQNTRIKGLFGSLNQDVPKAKPPVIPTKPVMSPSMASLDVIPSPKSISYLPGNITVTADNYITYQTGLRNQALLLQKTIRQLGGPLIKCRDYRPSEGDINIRRSRSQRQDQYDIDVNQYAAISGHPDTGVAWAIASLLQVATITADAVEIPRMKISDGSDHAFRSLMVDLVSTWHPIESLYDYVQLCWWYKVRYLHLHFTDDACWTLPNSRYPELLTPDKHYTERQITELNLYAQQHGVTIIPEVDVPGHSKLLAQTLPRLVGNEESLELSGGDTEGLLHPGLANTTPACTICPGRESTYEFLSEVVDDLCRWFPNSPYIHIGGDEVNKVPWTNCRHCQNYMKQHGLPNVEELYRHFIVRMNELVVKHGKQSIVWEGFKVDGLVEIPRDIIVMEYECYYELPGNLIEAGYQVVNTSWQPNYIVPTKSWPASQILKWHVRRWEHFLEHSLATPNGVDIDKTLPVLGAGMCSWGMEPLAGMQALRSRLPALAQRAWRPSKPVTYKEWEKSWALVDSRLDRLLNVLR